MSQRVFNFQMNANHNDWGPHYNITTISTKDRMLW